MPQGTPVFTPSGFPPGGPTAFLLAGINPGFTHDEFTVANPVVTTYLLHQTPGRFSLLVALNGKVLQENIEYTVNYDVGEFTFAVTLHAGDKIEARYAVSSVQTAAVIRITESVQPDLIAPTITDSVIEALQTPIGVSVADTVGQHPLTVTDVILASAAVIVTPPGDVDDGWASTVPAFTTSGGTLQVGNSAGEIREAFIRFSTGSNNMAGVTIAYAELRVVPDANTPVAALVKINADASGVAASPTSKTDLDGRTLTTATEHISTTAAAGTMLALDVTAVIQELATSGGATVNSVLLVLGDDGSAVDSFLQLRSFANTPGPPPQLLVYYG